MSVVDPVDRAARRVVRGARRTVRRLVRRLRSPRTGAGRGEDPTGERAFRRRLVRQGASLSPRTPRPVWQPWLNAALRDRAEAERALAEVRRCGLVPHADAPKNWDVLVAAGLILERTPRTASVLDMGAAAYSRLLPWLYLYGYRELVGIDLVEPRSAPTGPIRYLRMDLTATTFPDASFDVLTCLSVIEHGVDPEAYFAEAARLLRPGGFLLTSTDFWCEPVDTGGRLAYGVPIRIFTPADIDRWLDRARAAGLVPPEGVRYACDERVVHWSRFGLDYTFLNFVVEKPG